MMIVLGVTSAQFDQCQLGGCQMNNLGCVIAYLVVRTIDSDQQSICEAQSTLRYLINLDIVIFLPETAHPTVVSRNCSLIMVA